MAFARTSLAPLLFPLALISLGSVACSSRPEPMTPVSGLAPPPPADTKVSTTVITPSGESGTATELFERGKQLLLQEKYKEAADTFDLVLKGDPQGQLAAMSLLYAGTAYEGASDRDTALARYKTLTDNYPKEPLVKVALFRVGRILVQSERWQMLGNNADTLLARPDLTITETIEAHGEKALSLVEQGDEVTAGRSVTHARDLMEANHIGESGKISDEVAQVFFALGETRRVGSEKIKFDPMPANFGDAFETRSQGLLDAQAAFTDTMRTTDAMWATMAGFRVGTLYQQLHRDVMVVTAPSSAKTLKDKQLFEGAMRLRYRVLLTKGLKMMDATLRMNERVGEDNAWTSKTRAAKAELESELAAENAAIKKLPVSEEDLQKALDKLSGTADSKKK